MYRKATDAESAKMSNVMQSMEKERLKGKVVANVSHDIIKMLGNITGSVDCKIAKSDTSDLKGNKAFSGTLKITASVTDKGYLKVIEIPIGIVGSVHTLPSVEVVKQKLASVVIENPIHRSVGEKVAENLKNIEAREKKIAEDTKVASDKRVEERKVEAGVDVEAVKEKEGKEVTLPNGGFSYVPYAEVASTITYSKTALPLSIVEGDTICVAGRRYKVMEGKDAMNSEGKSSTWVLVLEK